MYFKPEFMSLSRPHPIWTTCGNNSFKISKAVIQARFLSGRYRCERLTSNFTSTKTSQLCSICTEGSIGSIEHILLFCPALENVRSQQLINLQEKSNISARTKQLINSYLTLPLKFQVQLLLDPSVLPEVTVEVQSGNNHIIEELFLFTRTWCYSMHMHRLQILGKWKQIK